MNTVCEQCEHEIEQRYKKFVAARSTGGVTVFNEANGTVPCYCVPLNDFEVVRHD